MGSPRRPEDPAQAPHPRGTPAATPPDRLPPDTLHTLLTALTARLRAADLAPTAKELADALWLAGHTPAAGLRPPPAVTPVDRPGDRPPPTEPEARPPTDVHNADEHLRSRGRTAAPPAPTRTTSLYGPAPIEGTPVTPTGEPRRRIPVPHPAVLPNPLALERSLRALQRYRPPTRPERRALDETATAERAADTGLVVPVFAARRRREAHLALVMDDSSSSVVWRGAFEELRQICERAGAFRDIVVHRIDPHTPLPTDLGDPSGRRLTLVLSDCVGPMWRSGRLQQLLHTWAANAPVAVVQPLPQRMWARTHLPARPGVLRRREGPAGRMEFTVRGTGRATVPPAGGIPIPVLAPRRSSFEAWTRLVTGATGQTLPAAAAMVLRRHPPAVERPRTTVDLEPAERVRAFRKNASPAAAQLAVYLAAVPLMLPVMQLVQRAMLVRSGPDVLAEVLLSGLLRRDDSGPTEAEGGPAYAFLDGVRDELLGQLGASSAALVLKHSSDYIEARYGRTVRNFPALAAAFLTGAVPAPTPVDPAALSHLADQDGPGLWAFAQVSTQVLRRLGTPPPSTVPDSLTHSGPAALVAKARAAYTHFGEHGTVRDLDTAIRLLGSATQEERRTTERAALFEELGEALLRRWLVRPLPEDLTAALDAAQNAISDGPPRAHLTLARVLHTMAEEVATGRLDTKLVPDWVWVQSGATDEPVRRRESAAAVLLSAADSSLAELTVPPEQYDRRYEDIAVTAATTRIRVLRRLAALGAPHGLRPPAPTEVQDPPDRTPPPRHRGDDRPRPARQPQASAGEWFTATLRIAVGVVQRLLDRAANTEETYPDGDPGTQPSERRESALLLRGGLFLDLARHHRGEGPVRPAAVDPTTAREYAERAGEDLHAGIDGMDWDAVDPSELCRAWLDYADAIELATDLLDDDARLRILQALDQARRSVGQDERSRAGILLRMARLLEQRYLSTGSWAHRDSAVAAWTEALPLLARRDPNRAAVLTSLGRQLTERGVDKDTATDVHAAVRALRAAIEATGPADPELPRRRALLGQAYIERFRADGKPADLQLADWALGAAARTVDDPELAAYAWWYRALCSALLARHAGSAARLQLAVDYCHRAQRGPTGLLETAVMTHWARAGRLERTGGPERALDEHRAVLALLSAAGVKTGTGLLRREVARLEAATG
ncbi:SAV_2336 N-terminal domain-related protein [Streptomyces sp. NPDC005963]|uniref:SAV_2336 N-terminal domain-related protein n=1 Tax=Streptomyces sp. NPDC005963 TaxID=3156721 RepID=UPI0033D647D0